MSTFNNYEEDKPSRAVYIGCTTFTAILFVAFFGFMAWIGSGPINYNHAVDAVAETVDSITE